MPPPPSVTACDVEIYFGGCRVKVTCSDEGIADRLRNDFSWFLQKRVETEVRTIGIRLIDAVPDWEQIKGCFLFRHFKGDVYGWGDRRWIRYPESLVFYDATCDRGTIYSPNSDLLYHYAYYLIIAKVGEALDLEGWHRFHAVGVLIDGAAVLFSMPVSGGKTTLALQLLQDPRITLFSEDTPLIDRHGQVSPFAVRLSLREPQAIHIPPRHIRRKLDPIFGEKFLVDVAFWGLHRVADMPHPVDAIFWGHKGAAAPSIQPLTSMQSLFRLLRAIVIGKDCPQRAEVFLRLSPGGLRTLLAIAVGRMRTAWALWRRTRSFDFRMSPDVALNAAFISEFVRTRAKNPDSGVLPPIPQDGAESLKGHE